MVITTKAALLRSTMFGTAIIFGGLAPVIMATNAHAQDYTSGGVVGSVYSATGAGQASVVVVLKSKDRGFQRTVTTGSDGSYRFARLPIGDYSLGIEGGVAENVRIAVGTSTTKNFAASGTTIDEIIATGTIQKSFDFEAATTGLTIDVDETFAVTPLGRDIASLTLLTPGASSGDSAFGNLVSIGGSSVAENVYYVNGMNTTDFRNFLGNASVPFEFYDQVQTKTGGLPAEFGRTTGGVSNAVTKSGTNEWHFGASVYHENKKLRSDARNTRLLTGDQPIVSANASEIRESTEYNFWLSGPIVEDRVFAYGLYSPRKSVATSNSNTAGTSTTFTDSDPFYGGKLDVVLTDNHLLEFTGWRSYNEQESSEVDATFDDAGQFLTQASTPLLGFSESGGDIWMGKYTGELAKWLTVSAMYGEQTNAQTVSSATDGNPAIRDRRDPSLGFVDVDQAANFRIDIGDDKRKLFRADADVYVDDVFGDHHFRLGFDREELTSVSSTINSGGIYYVLFDAGACDAQRAAPTGDECTRVREYSSGGEFDVETTAFYLQDSWSVTDNLTLNLGIRNESFENFNANGDGFISVKNQWAPRTSFAYQPDMDPSGTLFGSYSRYYLPVAANTNIRSAGAETFIHRWYELDSVNADFTPNFDPATLFSTQIFGDGIAPSPESLVDRNLKPQNMDEFVIGYNTSLEDKFDGELGNWSGGLAFTYTTLNRVIEDISIDAGVLAYCTAQGLANCEDTFGPRELHQYVLTNPGNDVDVVIEDLPGGPQRATLSAASLGYPDAKRTYKGLELKFDRVSDDDPLELHGSWTLSESKGNYEGSVKSDNGQDDAGLTTDFDFPELQENGDGLLPNHRAHKIKLYGNYALTDNFTIGANAQLTSPRKYGCLGEHPSGANNDLYGTSWFCGGVATPRGSQIKSDWARTLDLTLAYTVPSIKVGTMTVRADVFNVFNTESVLDRKETGDLAFSNPQVTDPNYGRATRYQSPRYVRLGLDWRY